MNILTPNIIISKNYSFMQAFMKGDRLSDLDPQDTNDVVIFNGEQNKYVYSLEHMFNFGQSDTVINLKIVDVDGNLEDSLFNETFYQKLMNKALRDFTSQPSATFPDFKNLVTNYSESQLRLYLAYGVGDRLENWTDPISCVLVGTNVDVANNGLRTYTYKFFAQVNNLFKPIPKKDDNDPNRNLDLELGSVVNKIFYETTGDLEIDVPEKIIAQLLKGYIAEACQINIENVIVVIPNLKNPEIKEFNKVTREQTGWGRSGSSRTVDNVGNIKELYKNKFGIDVYDISGPLNTPNVPGLTGDLHAERTNNSASKSYVKGFKLMSEEFPKEGGGTFPDAWKPIVKLFEGMNLYLSNKEPANLSPVVTYEPSLALCEVFHDFGMIKDKTAACVMVGDRTLLTDYVYFHSTPGALYNDYPPHELSIYGSVPLFASLNNFEDRIRQLRNRRKINSAFNESGFDELALTTDSVSQKSPDAVSVLVEYALENDIPIFLNNFTDSNVLSYSLKNTESYFGALKWAVGKNRLKYLYKELNENTEVTNKLLRSVGIVESKTSPMTPIEIARKLFKESLQTLEDKNISFVDSVRPLTDKELDELAIGKVKDIETLKNFPGFVKIDGNNASRLNLKIQEGLRVYSITQNQLANIAQFIIELNNHNAESSSGMQLLPGVNLPSSDYILAKVIEYMQRNSVELVIKTLPFFHISNTRFFNHPALFFSKKIPIIGLPEKTTTFDFFSGEWRITGYRHVITTSECYSEFALTKYLTSEKLKITNEVPKG